jgi:hypothetical protein
VENPPPERNPGLRLTGAISKKAFVKTIFKLKVKVMWKYLNFKSIYPKLSPTQP